MSKKQVTADAVEVTADAVEVSALTAAQKEERLQEVSIRIEEIGAAVKSEEVTDEQKASLLEEFKSLIDEAASLAKKTTKRKAGTVARESKLSILKSVPVAFQPRNTALELRGTLTGLAIDRRTGLYILTIYHSTGMKFNKTVEGVRLISPTYEQQEYLDSLIAEQKALQAELKEAKEAAKEETEEAEEAGE